MRQERQGDGTQLHNAPNGGGSGDIGDSSGGSIVEGRRSNAAALDNASGLLQNRIVIA